MATAEVQSVTHVISSEPTKVESCEPVEKPESEAVDNTTVMVIEKEEGEEVIVEEKKLEVEVDKEEEEVVSKEVEGDEEAAVEVPAQAEAEEDVPVPAQVASEADVPAQVAAEAEEPPLATTVIEVAEEKEACKETPAETPGVEEESKE